MPTESFYTGARVEMLSSISLLFGFLSLGSLLTNFAKTLAAALAQLKAFSLFLSKEFQRLIRSGRYGSYFFTFEESAQSKQMESQKGQVFLLISKDSLYCGCAQGFSICLGGLVEFRRKVALHSHRKLLLRYCYTVLNHLLAFIHVNYILNASTYPVASGIFQPAQERSSYSSNQKQGTTHQITLALHSYPLGGDRLKACIVADCKSSRPEDHCFGKADCFLAQRLYSRLANSPTDQITPAYLPVYTAAFTLNRSKMRCTQFNPSLLVNSSPSPKVNLLFSFSAAALCASFRGNKDIQKDPQISNAPSVYSFNLDYFDGATISILGIFEESIVFSSSQQGFRVFITSGGSYSTGEKEKLTSLNAPCLRKQRLPRNQFPNRQLSGQEIFSSQPPTIRSTRLSNKAISLSRNKFSKSLIISILKNGERQPFDLLPDCLIRLTPRTSSDRGKSGISSARPFCLEQLLMIACQLKASGRYKRFPRFLKSQSC